MILMRVLTAIEVKSVCYSVHVVTVHGPAGLEMVTIRPLECRSRGRKLLVMLSVPKKLTSMQLR